MIMSRWLKPRSMDHHEFSLSVVPLIALSYGLICHLLLPGHLPHDKLINSTLQHTKNLNHWGPGLPRGGGDVGEMLKLGIDRLINRKEVWSLID